MKKWFTLIVAVGMLGFTACSGGSGTGREKAKVSGEGNTELTLNVPADGRNVSDERTPAEFCHTPPANPR